MRTYRQIIAWAREDALEAFLWEQAEHWIHNAGSADPSEDCLEDRLGRPPTSDEWAAYGDEFSLALSRGIRAASAAYGDLDEDADDYDDLYEETIADCAAAAAAAIGGTR